MALSRAHGRRFRLPERRRYLIGIFLAALNWPLVLVATEPGSLAVKGAITAAAIAAAVLIHIGSRLAAESRRAGIAVAMAGILSIGSVVAYGMLGAVMRDHKAVWDAPHADLRPHRPLAGQARAQVLSAIPATATEITICATPLFPADQEALHEAAYWLIEIDERRSHSNTDGAERADCAGAEPGLPRRLAELPVRRRSPLVYAAIRDSGIRRGVAAAPEPTLLIASGQSAIAPIGTVSAIVAVLVALNAVPVILLGSGTGVRRPAAD